METKYIFFSGKGGVGKTSMSCATGVHHADSGKKTLIVTTDPAANLSDVFEQEIGHKITEIKGIENLYAMEIDPDVATAEYKERSLAPMREFFDDDLIRIAEEQLSGPCTEEMASFDKFIEFMDKDEFDVVVFDTAPTGHTIRLLELPMDWSAHIEESSKGSGNTCMGPVGMIQDSKEKYDRAIEKLRDDSITEFVFVMKPEETSLIETERSSNELKSLGIDTKRIVVNGIIPESEAENTFFKKRYDVQQKHLKRAHQVFNHVEIVEKKLFHTELKGIQLFRDFWSGTGEDEFFVEEHTLIEGEVRKSIEYKKRIEKLLSPVKGKKKNIFFSGKGGVGKTTMACITAVKTASEGYRTLLLTTDPAAHIGNVLGENVYHNITDVTGMENLYAVKIDGKKATEEYKEKVLKDAKEYLDEDSIAAMEEELNSPCTEEMAVFQKFMQYAVMDEFDVIVFDTAPTGHTLRLLELPMGWSKQIELKIGENKDISSDDLKESERFKRVIEELKDEEATTFSFVMYPEKTPMVEAKRAADELATLGIKTQMAVVNLVIPKKEAVTPFYKNRRNMQSKYILKIKEEFDISEIVQVPMYPNEIKGLKVLKEISKEVF